MWPFAVGKPLIMRFVCAPKDNPEPESNSNNNSNSQSELTLASFYRLRGPVVVTLSVNKIYKCQPCFSFHSHTAGWRNTVSIHAPAHGKYRLITLIKTCSRFCLPVVLHAIMNQQMTTSRERERGPFSSSAKPGNPRRTKCSFHPPSCTAQRLQLQQLSAALCVVL